MKAAKAFGANSSGQLLIVAALAIAILIASTSIYVYELATESQNVESSSTTELILALKTGLRNAVVSALANITAGGQKTVLAENLDMLADAYMRLQPQQPCQIRYTLLDGGGYEDSVKISWSSLGFGVSSAHILYTLKIFEPKSSLAINGAINVTTTLMVEGYYRADENKSIKTVNLTCRIFNENKPATAKQVAVYWEQGPGVWLPVQNPYIVDCGSGTYLISFTVTTSSDTVHVSVQMVDIRSISVAANATCIQA